MSTKLKAFAVCFSCTVHGYLTVACGITPKRAVLLLSHKMGTASHERARPEGHKTQAAENAFLYYFVSCLPRMYLKSCLRGGEGGVKNAREPGVLLQM